MAADYKRDDNILEVMDSLLETYEAFNIVLKGQNVVHKVQAAKMMREMNMRLEERLSNYSQTFANIDKDDDELINKKVEEFKLVGEKVKIVEEVIGKTDVLMDKYYPVKAKMVKKKRSRLRKFNKKKIRD